MKTKSIFLQFAPVLVAGTLLLTGFKPAFAQGDSGGDSAQPPASTETTKKEPEKAAGDESKLKNVDDKRPYSQEAVDCYNKGVEKHQQGFLNDAIDLYKKALVADDRMEEAYSNLGVIYAAQQNYPRALEAFNKALSLKPGRPTTLNGLGTVLYAKGRVDEAKEKWQQAIDVDPKFASAYYNMGNALESEKDVHGAIVSYTKAIEVKPEMPDPYYRIGSLLDKSKHLSQAEVFLKKAMALKPDGDFVLDARRQLNAIDAEFSKEARRETALPAAVGENPREKARGRESVESAGSPQSSQPSPARQEEKAAPAKGGGKKFQLFKRKEKPAATSKVETMPDKDNPELQPQK